MFYDQLFHFKYGRYACKQQRSNKFPFINDENYHNVELVDVSIKNIIIC